MKKYAVIENFLRDNAPNGYNETDEWAQWPEESNVDSLAEAVAGFHEMVADGYCAPEDDDEEKKVIVRIRIGVWDDEGYFEEMDSEIVHIDITG